MEDFPEEAPNSRKPFGSINGSRRRGGGVNGPAERHPARSMKEEMKGLLAILAVGLATCLAQGQTNSVSYDWKAHEEQIDTLFLKHIPEILKGEREKIEAILAKDKADQYMKQFEDGLRSETGIVMIEGGQNRWLEIAYREGYAQKVLFRLGYSSGLAQQAERKQ